MVRLMTFAFALMVLSGCGGDGGGGSGSSGIPCTSISGGGTQTSSSGTCANCSIQSLPSAADGDTGSFARMHYPSLASGNLSVRVTAQNGIVYPAGTSLAVIRALDFTGDSVGVSLLLQTYLDGAPQESRNIGSLDVAGGQDEPVGRASIRTESPFDAAELLFQRSGGQGTVSLFVHEFCTNQ